MPRRPTLAAREAQFIAWFKEHGIPWGRQEVMTFAFDANGERPRLEKKGLRPAPQKRKSGL